MSDRFVGRKLVVTGGSSGMGLATAATVVAEGGSAVLIGRNQTKLDEAVQSLGGGERIATIAGDLNDSSEVANVVETIARDHADSSMLVNSAGFFIPKDFLVTTLLHTTPTWTSTAAPSSSPRASSV